MLRPEDLPAWMRPRRQGIDWGIFLVVIICIPLVLPLLTRRGVPLATDAEVFELRSVEIAQLVRSGLLFSRWAPDFTYGMGSPLFNYLAPLPHYLAGYHQVITDTSPADSINLWLSVSILAASMGMYLYIRQRWSAPHGVVAAFLYVYGPLIAITMPYQLGNLGALMALGLLPWVVWSLDRLYLVPKSRSLILAAFLSGAFLLSDSRIAALGILVVIANVATLRRLSPCGNFSYVATAFGAGIMLAAVFWFPALTERDQIHWLSAGIDPRLADPVPLTEMFGPLSAIDPRLFNPPIYRGIGTGTLAAVLAGLIILLIKRAYLRADVVLFLVLGLILAGLATPAFYGLWPSPRDFQPLLPYHALAVATFCLAVVGAQAATWLAVPAWRLVVVPLLLALCLGSPLTAIASLPSMGTDYYAGELTIFTSTDYELRGYHVGSFISGLLLPEAAPKLPPPQPQLLTTLQTNTFSRINRRAYGSDVQINTIEHNPLSVRYVFDVPRPTDIELYILGYPGWTGSIDGQRQGLQTTPEGLLVVPVPKLTGELQIWMEGTPARYLAWVITVLGVALLLLVARRIRGAADGEAHMSSALSGRQLTVFGLLLAAYAVITPGISRSPDHFALGTSPDGSTPLARTFANKVRLVGYSLDFPAEGAGAGEQIRLVLYWQANESIPDNAQSTVQLVGAKDSVAPANPHRHPGGIPTSRWLPGSIIRDDFVLDLPPGVQPGDYRLQVGIGQCDTQILLPCDTIKPSPALDSGDQNGIMIPQSVKIR
jgi:hypothetical protein